MSTISGWFKSTEQPATLILRAPLYVLSQHFIRRYNSSARCMGEDSCELCRRGIKMQTQGVVVASREGSDNAALLRITSSQHQLHQAWEAMGPNLQGLKIQVEHKNGRILGAKALGRTVTSLVPVDNYLARIGQGLYDEIIRDAISDLNSDWTGTSD